jgi:hypothetical protein
MVMFFVWLLFVIVFVCGFECYELFLVTRVRPALGTWRKRDRKRDNSPPPVDPLLGPAISPEDNDCLEWVNAKWIAIQLEICAGCEWEWFDLDVKQLEDGVGLCKDCRKSTPLYCNNNVDPGLGCPDLPPLTQIEEMPSHLCMH